jgi:WD repeat-containing protein 1 (actin-interacting protein 1)
MKAFLYDAESSSKICELKGHKGTINACAWSPNGAQVVTASADKTVCVWDASNGSCLGTCAFGGAKPAPEDMQVGVAWTGNTIISLSLRGELTYLDPADIAAPKMVIRGHNKNITALATDAEGSTLVSASYDGILNKFTVGRPDAKPLEGKGHTNAIVDLAICGDTLTSCGLDDTLRTYSLASFSVVGDPVPLGGAPAGLALSSDGTICVVITNKAILVLSKQGAGWAPGSSTPIAFSALGVAISPSKTEVAVACDDSQIRMYSLSGTALTAGSPLTQHKSPVTRVGYSPCGKFLASADAVCPPPVALNVCVGRRRKTFGSARVSARRPPVGACCAH